MKELVKQNINFLEYPLWFQDEKLSTGLQLGMTWSDREGYIYKSGYNIPVKIDGIFLIYLLMQSQKNNYSEKLYLTRYQILKDCGRGTSKVWYKRLEESLNRWVRVDITFNGKFYDGVKYSTIVFHIIDSWKIDEQTNKLVVRFSPEFMEMMKGKGFFKYINFTEFKQLDSPIATRLYEILSKTFHGRDVWEIDAIKLAKKIPLNKKYPAHIIPKIKAAINRINKKTKLKIELTIRHKARGKAILIFTKLPVEKPLKATIKKQPTLDITITDEFAQVLQALPEGKRKQKSIIEIIHKYYKEFGSDYVIRNIKYANKNAKNNYRSYLLNSLKENWGKIITEDEKEKLHKIKEDIALRQEQIRDEKKLITELQKAQDNQVLASKYINELSSEDRISLEKEAIQQISKINPSIIENLKSESMAVNTAANMSLKATMEKLILERHDYR